MENYLIELHAHTSQTSRCGQVSAEEVVRLYKDAGYHGLTITDHCFKQYFDSMGPICWADKVGCYLSGWRAACAAGEELGLRIYLGMEFRNLETDDDFLVYGLSPAFLLDNEDIFELSLKKAIDRFHAVGATVIQAHPVRMILAIPLGQKLFRDFGQLAMQELFTHGTPVPQVPFTHMELVHERSQQLSFLRVCNLREPEALDGIEAYNGNIEWCQDPREIESILERWPHLAWTSASDFHQPVHLAKGGTYFAALPIDDTELAQSICKRKMTGYHTSNGVQVRSI